MSRDVGRRDIRPLDKSTNDARFPFEGVQDAGAKLALVEISPEAYTEISIATILTGRTWVVPTLSRGRLFLRNDREVVCLNLNP